MLILTNKDLLYTTQNSAQCYVAAMDGREVSGRMDPCIYMAELLHCTPETITLLLISYTPIQNKVIFLKGILCHFCGTGRLGDQDPGGYSYILRKA